MLGIFKRKKLDEITEATLFVDAILSAVDEGFTEVAGLINDSPEFVSSPQIDEQDSDKFLLIVLAGNFKFISRLFSAHTEYRLTNAILERLSCTFEAEPDQFMKAIDQYGKFLSKVNHPSNNILYSMSKAVFYKYDLSEYQEEYFKKLNAPNPIFLKRMDEAIETFIWDWDSVKQKIS